MTSASLFSSVFGRQPLTVLSIKGLKAEKIKKKNTEKMKETTEIISTRKRQVS